ncbi:MAG: hypothetical protein M3457_00530 [Chloroflexota bacterium]|nr:hypothetical protein [Chloroflexota bacterium]
MILIVILIVMLFGVAPFGFGDEPGSPDCAGPVQAADGCGDANERGAWQGSLSPAGGCNLLDASLLMERGSALQLVNLRTLAVRDVPLNPDVARIVERGRNLLEGVVPARWHVARTSNDLEQRVAVYDRQSGETVFDVAFALRIELSTAVASSSGRFTVHVQANNVASEVTVLDAQSSTTRSLSIPHEARLAAFAIGVAFSPNETCAAISMERVGGDGAETWLLDLESGEVRPLPVPGAFVLGWIRHQV